MSYIHNGGIAVVIVAQWQSTGVHNQMIPGSPVVDVASDQLVKMVPPTGNGLGLDYQLVLIKRVTT